MTHAEAAHSLSGKTADSHQQMTLIGALIQHALVVKLPYCNRTAHVLALYSSHTHAAEVTPAVRLSKFVNHDDTEQCRLMSLVHVCRCTT